MNKEFLIQLTSKLYKLTLLFPKKEPLRYKIREVADEILTDSTFLFGENAKKSTIVEKVGFSTIVGKVANNLENNLESNLEVLDSFFEVAKAQNWVSPNEVLAVQKEYDTLKGELKNLKTEEKKSSSVEILEKEEKPVLKVEFRPVQVQGVSERQEKILSFLRENGRAQVWQVKELFPEVTKRTLRRDFEHMLKQGVIERIGERNDTFYEVKISRA